MKLLTHIKNRKIITSAAVVAFVATTGGVSYALVSSQPEEKPVAQATEVKESPAETPVPTVSPTPAPEAVVETSKAAAPNASSTPAPKTKEVNENPYGSDNHLAYVYEKRLNAGKKVGLWGGASSWPAQARAAGIAVDNHVEVGAAIAIGNIVYFVDSENDNSITMSTFMNGKVLTQVVDKTSPSFKQFRYIH